MKRFSLGERYYYNHLDPAYRNAYKTLIEGFMKHESTIVLSGIRNTDFRVIDVFEAVNLDHPDMFWPDYYHISYVKLPGRLITTPSYFFGGKETAQLNAEVYAWKKKVCAQIPASVSKAEKVWMIYDFLARQVTYQESDLRFSNTIIGPMKKNMHASVCEGVAKAFKLLCDETGIPCIVVTGDARPSSQPGGPHAWNMVRIGNSYRHVDATWEISYAHYHGIADDCHFLHKDADMQKYQWDRSAVPECR